LVRSRDAACAGNHAGFAADHQIPAMFSHPQSPHDSRMEPALYAIRVNGHMGAMLLAAFPALVPEHLGHVTVLTGVLDRSALYGVLAEIESLGLDLLEVRQVRPKLESPETGDSRSP
jgi:hypothetical protein